MGLTLVNIILSKAIHLTYMMGAGKRSKIYYNLNKSMRLSRIFFKLRNDFLSNVNLTDPLEDNRDAEALDKHDFS